MRILLDMDGPLADFDRHFWELHSHRFDSWDISDHTEQSARYISDHLTDKREKAHSWRIFQESGWFRDLPPTPGAIESVNELLDRKVEVWVVTKPMESNPSCRDDKGAWLQEHIPRLVRNLIIAPDKSLVNGTVLLDDAPRPDWFGAATWAPIIYSTPFNQDGSVWANLPHFTWSDGVDRLIDLARDAEEWIGRQ